MSAARPDATAAKVLPEGALRERLAAHRAAGRRVVLTNGAFDLLHVGHVRSLEAARALGDLLVVAVNADASVRASRGPGRPVVPGDERAEVLAALACVDHVVLFEDATVDRLLASLRPDVHAKGRDYDETTLPEAATNRRLGIAMAFVGDEKAHAASTLLARSAAAPAGSDRCTVLRRGPVRGLVLRAARGLLDAEGWLDLDALATTEAGRIVEGPPRRFVRRIELDGAVVYLKVTRPYDRRRSPLVEFGNHRLLRAAGFRAPEPWLCLERPGGARPLGALLTREAPGVPLDAWLGARLPGAAARERLAWAGGVGRAVRALHTACFLQPDLQAWHLLVDGSPAAAQGAIHFIDLMRVTRCAPRVPRERAVQGLAALALSLRPVTDRRFRLAVLKAYLGGDLADARPWLRALDRRIGRLLQRPSFRHLADEA